MIWDSRVGQWCDLGDQDSSVSGGECSHAQEHTDRIQYMLYYHEIEIRREDMKAPWLPHCKNPDVLKALPLLAHRFA